jgi:hypothetical protein
MPATTDPMGQRTADLTAESAELGGTLDARDD